MDVLFFVRENGDRFVVDKVIERKRSAALKAGGSGIMHRVLAHMQADAEQSVQSPAGEFRLFLDNTEWFIEWDLEDDDPSAYNQPGFEDMGREPHYADDTGPEGYADPDVGWAPDPDFEDDMA